MSNGLKCACGHWEMDHDPMTFECTERPCECKSLHTDTPIEA